MTRMKMWQKDGAKRVMVVEISKPFGSPKAIYEFNWLYFFCSNAGYSDDEYSLPVLHMDSEDEEEPGGVMQIQN